MVQSCCVAMRCFHKRVAQMCGHEVYTATHSRRAGGRQESLWRGYVALLVHSVVPPRKRMLSQESKVEGKWI